MHNPGLPPDVNLIAYWRFDEANTEDVGLDASGQSWTAQHNLTVVNPAGVEPGKKGNARLFDGTSTYAQPALSTELAKLNKLTLIAWGRLSSVKSSGSLLRTILACDGADDGDSRQNTVYALAVDNEGRLVFRYDVGTGVPVILRSASGVVRINRYHCLKVTREVVLAQCRVRCFYNGEELPWVSGTNGGTPIAAEQLNILALPAPFGGQDSICRVGVSQKAPDSFWHGALDEISCHNMARAPDPYLRGAYYRAVLTGTFARLSDSGAVRSLGVADLGGGTRWYVYEREQNLYAIREDSLGRFGVETQLTIGGMSYTGAPVPAGASQVRLVYEPVSDTLTIAFIAGGKVYRITGDITDEPSTQNMPYTVDTATIVKARELADTAIYNAGGHGYNLSLTSIGTSTPAAPSVAFLNSKTQGFGLRVANVGASGVAIYRVVSGHEMELVRLTGLTEYFFPITPRVYGAGYRARPLLSGGAMVALSVSATLYDYLGGLGLVAPLFNPDALTFNTSGDDGTELRLNAGAGLSELDARAVTITNRQPVKQAVMDAGGVVGAGGSTYTYDAALVSITNRSPVKQAVVDVGGVVGAGGSTLFTISSSRPGARSVST